MSHLDLIHVNQGLAKAKINLLKEEGALVVAAIIDVQVMHNEIV